MSDEELKKEFEEIKKLIKDKPVTGSSIFLTLLFLLFIGGCFKSCGY